MRDLILSMLASASMAIALKGFRDQRGNRFGILLGNYVVCVLLAAIMAPEKSRLLSPAPVTVICGLSSGFLFVASLAAMQSCIRENGAALTAAFSKLGLLVTLAVSVLCFGERPSARQGVGIALVIAALILINGGGEGREGAAKGGVWLLILTLLTGGASDVTAKVFERVGSRSEDGAYFFFLFLTAMLLTALLALRERRKTGKGVRLADAIAGAAVGVPNFFSSRLLLRALVTLPAFFVYPVFSVGTILIVMAVGALAFRERHTRRQLTGIGLILIALALLN